MVLKTASVKIFVPDYYNSARGRLQSARRPCRPGDRRLACGRAGTPAAGDPRRGIPGIYPDLFIAAHFGGIMRILLIEDDEMIARAIIDALRPAGYATDWLDGGLKARRL